MLEFGSLFLLIFELFLENSIHSTQEIQLNTCCTKPKIVDLKKVFDSF